MSSTASNEKLLECQTCFRTFHTQGQFGQHARICRGNSSNRSISRKVSPSNEYRYKYSFLEKQSKKELHIKTRFVLNWNNGECSSSSWKEMAKKHHLDDNSVRKLLSSNALDSVYFTVRNRKESGLIVANFIIKSVYSAKTNIHSAKLLIEDAVEMVQNRLPHHMTMTMHLCKVKDCKELVIRDTEGHCSRHRAQKYHKKQKQQSPPAVVQSRQRKRPLSAIECGSNCESKSKRLKTICCDLSYDVLYKFLVCSCSIFQTPLNLVNVSINQSLLRQNGINLISVNYSTCIPNTKQVLNRNDYLICIGVRKDIDSYLSYHNAHDRMIHNENSIRFEQFCDELIKYYIVYVPLPTPLIGMTLADIRLYEYGINVLSINLKVQHAANLTTTAFKPNDMLLCCFNRANDKHEQLSNAFLQTK
eukprot:63135_1